MIRYVLSLPAPSSCVLRVVARVSELTAEPLRISLPSQNPRGSEPALRLDSLASYSPDEPLGLRRVTQTVWAIAHGGANELCVDYVLRAEDPGAQGVHPGGAYFEGRDIFARVLSDDGRHDAAGCEVEFALPEDSWRVHTTLDPLGDRTFRAADPDNLSDSIIDLSACDPVEFKAAGRAHALVISGDELTPLGRPLALDLAEMVARAARRLGEAPYESFLFVLRLGGAKTGAALRQKSLTLWARSEAFETDEGYQDLLSRFGRGFLGAWMDPRAGREPARHAWLTAGAASFFAWQSLAQSGRLSPEGYLGHIRRQIAALEGLPERRVKTLEDASMDGWTEHPEPDARAFYEARSELAAMLLDAAIKLRGTSSLEAVVRQLFRKYISQGEALPEEGIEAEFASATGSDMSDLIDTYGRTTEALPVARVLSSLVTSDLS